MKSVGKGVLGRGNTFFSDPRQRRTWHWQELKREDSVQGGWREEKQE